MSGGGDELRAGHIYVADGTGLAHSYGCYPCEGSMGNMDYSRPELISGYDAPSAAMYLGHAGETIYTGATYITDPSAEQSVCYPASVVSYGYPAYSGTPGLVPAPHEASYPTMEHVPAKDLNRQMMLGANGEFDDGKPKRRRTATVAQRRAANIRERRRMFNLNEAFDLLRKRVPTFAYEKRLSRIETLRLAITYIAFMSEIIEGKTPEEVKLVSIKGGNGIWNSSGKKDGDEDEDDEDGMGLDLNGDGSMSSSPGNSEFAVQSSVIELH